MGRAAGQRRPRFRQMFGFRFFGLCWKLQHDRALPAFAKMREQHDLAVGKFERIMVRAGLVHVDLLELRDLVRQRPALLEQNLEAGEMALDLILKSDLGAWKEADSYLASSIAENPRPSYSRIAS